MNGSGADDAVLCGYLDALLESSAQPVPVDANNAGATAWWLCAVGRLQLLLPNAALGKAMECASLAAAPADWHLARLRIGDTDWRVAELVRCVAPGSATPPVETLMPVTGSDWMLAVPGHPESISLPADAIQWRPHRTSRAWLAGMSRDGRYMALDVHTLVAQTAEILGAGVEDASS